MQLSSHSGIGGSFVVVDLLLIVAPIVEIFVFVLVLFCYTVLSALFTFAIVFMRKRELVTLLNCFPDVL